MTSLTDRYVWGVLRAIPESQRADLEPEIRALVADAVEARLASGEARSDAAEYAALEELGDPEALAARYSGRTSYLIGPRLYGAWQRVVVPVLLVVVPIVAIVSGAASVLAGSTIGQVIVAALSSGFLTAVMILFWVTLVFAFIERSGNADSVPELVWTPDRLPDVPAPERIGLGELIASVSASIAVAVVIIWQQVAPPFTVDGQAEPLFDPALWSFWLPYFLIITGIEVLFTIRLYVAGRWTFGFAVVNAVLGAAFALPALWLLANDLLVNPAVVAAVDAETGGGWLGPTTLIIGLTVAIIVAWDAIDGFRKAYRNAALDPSPA